ncbi:MAG: hypothetical protein KGO50_05055 [Myxococcales bacterium]|nr:hypothetical protein [Myxococcales bacterium]
MNSRRPVTAGHSWKPAILSLLFGMLTASEAFAQQQEEESASASDNTTQPQATEATAADDGNAENAADDGNAENAADDGTAAASSDTPAFVRHEWRYSNALIARLNPLGLTNQAQIGWRMNLYDNPQSDLTKGSYFAAMFAPSFSPAWVRPGALLEFQPAAIFKTSVMYEYGYHFGTFDTVQSFESPTEEYSDARQDERSAENSYSTTGHTITLSNLLQVKVWNIALRTNYRAVWQQMDLRNNDTVFYDIVYDVLAPGNGWLHTTDTDLLYVSGGPITVGLRHTWVAVQYQENDFLNGESTDTENTPLHRLGPLFAYRFNNRTMSRFNQPSVFVLANWWLQHRYRTGQEISQALPYVVVGFAFNGNPGRISQ